MTSSGFSSRQELLKATITYIISSVSVAKKRVSQFLQKRGWDIFILAVLAVFFIFIFREALFSDKFLLIGDEQVELYPLRMVAWDMIRHGHLPLWTPLILSGYPLLSVVQLAIGYPVTWLHLIVPGYWADQIFILAPYLLSTIFTYAYLREVGRSHIGSFIGALAYGYGGFMYSPLGTIGPHSNSAAWMPLLLLGASRVRRGSFLPCLLLSTVAYTMSILAGSAQFYVFCGILALAYGTFLSLIPGNDGASEPAKLFSWQRWRPLIVVTASMALAAGVAAFQILETWTAVKLSVRGDYRYDQAIDGSFTFKTALGALFDPVHHSTDTSSYMPLLALVLAIVAIIHALRRADFRPQICFWMIVAVIAWALILGNNTPLFRLYYNIPVVRRFRYPSRHTLEWTFAIAVLAGYGWDILANLIMKAKETRLPRSLWQDGLKIISGGALVLMAVGAQVYWLDYIKSAVSYLIRSGAELDYNYLACKVLFTIIICLALMLFLSMTSRGLQKVLLAAAVALYCFAEPNMAMMNVYTSASGLTVKRLQTLGDTTQFLQKHLDWQGRDFSVINPLAMSPLPERDSDTVNTTALGGIQNIAGYEPLILARHYRALHSFPVPGEITNADPLITPDHALLSLKSHVLDLLNAHFVTSYTNLSSLPNGLINKYGITFDAKNLVSDSVRDGAFSLDCGDVEADTLALVTVLANSLYVEDKTPVARISIHTTDGQLIERYLLAGVDTSEWSYAYPLHKRVIRHSLATIFESAPSDEANSFLAHKYFARMDLGKRVRVERMEVKSLIHSVAVVVFKASLHDSIANRSTTLPEPAPSRWQKVYDKNGLIILKNLRTLPRAWLTPTAEALDQVEILRRIRGESNPDFDPKKTALVEMDPAKLPALTDDPLSEDSYARILTYEPARLVIETNSNKQAVLVVSEMHYPGWAATLDGVKTPIHQTNYLLRGIFVPGGKHSIEMIYKAPGARIGALISLATILLISAFAIYSRRSIQDKKGNCSQVF